MKLLSILLLSYNNLDAIYATLDSIFCQDYPALELEAYRRAEATERLAQERASRLRLQLNDLLDQVSARYEQTGQEIEALSEDIRANMKRLQDALSDLELIFDETTGKFDTMDADLPEEEAADE